MSDDSNQNALSTIAKSDVARGLKGKAQRALLRFIAGSIGHPYFQEVRDKLDQVEGRSRVNLMLAEAVGRQAISDPDIMERAKARFLGEAYRKQENVEAVAAIAADELRSQGAEPDPARDDNAEPTDDWMNAFTREAENASSDQLRERLGKLLAGEIDKPGTFTRSTIRAVAEMDQTTLEWLQRVLPYRIGTQIFRDEKWNEGEFFALAVELEDAGLISGSTGFTHMTLTFDAAGHAFLVNQSHSLVARAAPNFTMQIGVWILTRVGREIAALLPQPDERLALRHAAKVMKKAGLQRIWMGRTVAMPNNMVSVTDDETLWSPTAGSPNGT